MLLTYKYSEFVFLTVCTVVMQIRLFLVIFSHLVEFQVCAYLSLDIVETYWAVRPNQYHCTGRPNTTA